MKAVVQRKYGPAGEVLCVEEVPEPVLEHDGVLVRVHAASVHPDVWHTINGLPLISRLMGGGVTKPNNAIPGTDVAGIVEAVGSGVTRFKAGEAVFGTTVFMRLWNGGTYAELASVPERMLVHKPANVSFEQAATVPTPGVITLCNLRPQRIAVGARVLINGAGGNVGALAIQIAKAHGAHVTGIDSPARLQSMREHGADRVIDYTKENVARGDERFDLIFDVATTLPIADCERLLAPDGVHWIVGHDHYGKASGRVFGSIPRMVRFMLRGMMRKGANAVDMKLPPIEALLETLRKHLDHGTIVPIVAKTFALDEVPAALECLERAQVPGRVVIKIR